MTPASALHNKGTPGVTPKISVIIPVYNTSVYLRRCLNSVCGQTLREIEIICIDDASTDNSHAILQEYAGKDSRLRISHLQKNEGAGNARNKGMALATGDYIAFVDSDDDIQLDFYEKLFAKASAEKADIVKGSLCEDSGAKHTLWKVNSPCAGANRFRFLFQFTTAIFRSQLLRDNNVRFLPDTSYNEDLAFALQAVTAAKTIAIIDDALYYYRRREGSINAKSLSLRKIIGGIKTARLMADYLNAALLEREEYRLAFDCYVTLRLCLLPARVAPENRTAACGLVAACLLELFTECHDTAVFLHRGKTIYDLLAANDVAGIADHLLRQAPEKTILAGLRGRHIAEATTTRQR